jgi:hypothetical protein
MFCSLLLLASAQKPTIVIDNPPKAVIDVLAENKKGTRAVGLTNAKVCLLTKTRSAWRIRPLQNKEGMTSMVEDLFDKEEDAFLLTNYQRAGPNSWSCLSYVFLLTPEAAAASAGEWGPWRFGLRLEGTAGRLVKINGSAIAAKPCAIAISTIIPTKCRPCRLIS